MENRRHLSVLSLPLKALHGLLLAVLLTDVSNAYIRETHELEVTIPNALGAYDRDTLAEEQKLSYDIYMCFLENQVRSHAFMYYDYPVFHFFTGVQNQLVLFLRTSILFAMSRKQKTMLPVCGWWTISINKSLMGYIFARRLAWSCRNLSFSRP